jgi:hypothetical protein
MLYLRGRYGIGLIILGVAEPIPHTDGVWDPGVRDADRNGFIPSTIWDPGVLGRFACENSFSAPRSASDFSNSLKPRTLVLVDCAAEGGGALPRTSAGAGGL